jgi:hypothetical protein
MKGTKSEGELRATNIRASRNLSIEGSQKGQMREAATADTREAATAKTHSLTPLR